MSDGLILQVTLQMLGCCKMENAANVFHATDPPICVVLVSMQISARPHGPTIVTQNQQ